MQLTQSPTNSFAGYPSITGFSPHLALQVTISGELDPRTGYLRNIKDIDHAVRQNVIPAFAEDRRTLFTQPILALDLLQSSLGDQSAGRTTVQQVRLALGPYLSVSCLASEKPMIRLSQRFEFSASHRLHSSQLSDEENRRSFGKCNNPYGHGHNYEVQVTLRGTPDAGGVLIDIPSFEHIVDDAIIQRFDHKNLNVELPEFRDLMPSVENIAMVIHRLLKPRLASPHSELASVTVWETSKTWCEYSE